MKKIFLMLLIAFVVQGVSAQPEARRKTQQPIRSNADNITMRSKITFPVTANMSEDVVWRRDIYRELNLEEDANAGLYYPVEPMGSQMNLFTYIFKLMMSNQIKVYEYRLDGNEVFNDAAIVQRKAFLDNYHIYYETNNGRTHIDNSDIPSREVKGYFIKESAYYDQSTSTFHTKVLALCPIMMREDDFGEGSTKYPLFWVKYDDLAPFLAKQIIMTSTLNNAATRSIDDYFTLNQYRGKIYKTTNMLGRTLAQYCNTDSALTAEQRRIERELVEFEKSVWGEPEKKEQAQAVAADSVAVSKKEARATARGRRTRTSEPKVRQTKQRSSGTSSPGSSARVSVRRQRR